MVKIFQSTQKMIYNQPHLHQTYLNTYYQGNIPGPCHLDNKCLRRYSLHNPSDPLKYRSNSSEYPIAFREIQNKLAVEDSARYEPDNQGTYCSLYVYDFMQALNVPLPKNCPATNLELDAISIRNWLHHHGAVLGWKKITDISKVDTTKEIVIAFKHDLNSIYGHWALAIPVQNQTNQCALMTFAGRHRHKSKVVDISNYDMFSFKPRCFAMKESPIQARMSYTNKIISLFLSKNPPPKNFSTWLITRAIVCAEDRRYYGHSGVDKKSIIRATYKTFIKAQTQGGSTIEQQTTRIILNWYERTLERKVNESLIALNLETKWTKEEILWTYVNICYFGRSTWGITDACRRLLDKRPQDLDIENAAFVAACLKYPFGSTSEWSSEQRSIRTMKIKTWLNQ